MYGVSKIASAENIMLVSFSGVTPMFMAKILSALAENGVVVDMISQTTPSGSNIRFSFTASFSYFDTIIKSVAKAKGENPSPMISGGYSKINLFGEDMVESVGVAARALAALSQRGIDISMITTSDLDISILVRSEDEDIALSILKQAYAL